MEDKAIRVVQISDPHLYADPTQTLYGLNTYDCFCSVVAEVAQRKPELALLTGDLVHDESEQGYRLLRQGLAPMEVPTHLIPGNHDNLAFMQAEFATGPISCSKLIRLENWQILMLNSQVPGQVHGHLDALELRWLEQCLSNSEVEHSLVVLHHHPVPVGTKWLDPLGLDNADPLFELIAASPQVKGLVWGHVHQEFDEERAGVRLLSTPSTCIQFKPNTIDFELDFIAPGYRWFELYADGRFETSVHRLPRMPEGLDPDAAGYGV
jgi:Icc protein